MLLIAEIGAGIAAFVFRGEVEGFFDGKKDELLMQYKEGDDSAITDSWDKVHEQLVSSLKIIIPKDQRM